ncbi:MAG: hypothetical protein HQL58_11740 [Magnetococcales bacterium]|nr:hypothetical protein [Magnetococcales bacterium]
MALTSRQLQQKRERKSAKDKQRRNLIGGASSANSGIRELSFAIQFPVHECMISKDLHSSGIGDLLVSRKLPNGKVSFSMFLLDMYCMGVKDAFFRTVPIEQYQVIIERRHNDMDSIQSTCAKKLIDGAVAYANMLGLAPHNDYKLAKILLDDIDASLCPTEFEYGSDGKPLYITGQDDTPAQARFVYNQLIKNCGEGNFDFVIASDTEEEE